MSITKKLMVVGIVLFGISCSSEPEFTKTIKDSTEAPKEETPETFPSHVVIYRSAVNGNVLTARSEIGRPKVGGRTTSLVIDHTDSTHFVATASDGGIWNSNDRGLSWTVVNDRFPSLIMSDLEQDPFDPFRFYAASRSTIQGANGEYFSSIYISSDGAQSFDVMPTADSTNKTTLVKSIKCSPTQPGVIYALIDDNVFFEPRRLMRSTDSGISFERVFDVDEIGENFHDIHFDNSGRLYVMGNFNLYSSSTGNPGSFLPHGDSLLFSFGAGVFRTAPSNDSIMYIVGRPMTGGSMVCIRSDSSGANWNHLSGFSSGSFGAALGIHPLNPDILFAGGVSLRATDDGGQTFNSGSFNGIDNWDIVYDAHGGSVYQINDQGMGRLDINPISFPIFGGSAIDLDSNYRNQRLHQGDFHLTKSALLIGVQDDGSNWTASASDRFKGLGGGDGGYCYFHQQDSAVVYTSTQYGGLRRINDIYGWPIGIGPQNFDGILGQLDQDGDSRPDEGGLFVTPYWVNYADGDQLYYQTKKRVWRSADRGNNWEPFTPSYDHIGFRSYMQIDGHSRANPLLYYSVENELFVIPNAASADSSDAIQFTTPHNIQDLKVSYQNDSTVFIAHTYRSDARISKVSGMMGSKPQWNDISGDLPVESIVKCIQVSALDEDRLAVGTTDGLYVSEDAGQHWTKDSLFPNVEVRRMRVRPGDDRLFLFTYGRGPWSADFLSISTSLKPHNNQENLLSVYPNPSSDIVYVNLAEMNSANAISLYDASGRLVLSQSIRQAQTSQIDVSKLEPGRYTLVIKNNQELLDTSPIYVIH